MCLVVEEMFLVCFVFVYFGYDVCFDFEFDGLGGIDLELCILGFMEEECDYVFVGWFNVFFLLKGYVDFGIDLCNYDFECSWK